jgi:hypothetical protein
VLLAVGSSERHLACDNANSANAVTRLASDSSQRLFLFTHEPFSFWRLELIDKVASLQKEDGSFVGEKRWMESNPVLTTAYVVLALQEAQRDLREHPAKP